ncbi:transposase [candidate division WOR-3 bacterium]|nr:transposase [candidate division WOR-3 bacterium]
MRTARFTYKYAYHHLMSRGLNKNDIFINNHDRERFLWLLGKKAQLYKIDIFAYCLMRNHFHIVLCNSSGRMNYMMRDLNGGYASYFRKKHGGVGYLFQDRYKSTLIENEGYLYKVIQYTLVNPYVAGFVENPFDYEWSSINSYFSLGNSFINVSLVREMFDNEDDYIMSILESKRIIIEPKKCRFGDYIGNISFEKIIEEKFDRRKNVSKEHPNMRRKKEAKEFEFISPNFIIETFKIFYNIKDFEKFICKRSYGVSRKIDTLIRLLKERCGLTYKEISLFLDLRYNSLPHRYSRSDRWSIPQELLKNINRCKK